MAPFIKFTRLTITNGAEEKAQVFINTSFILKAEYSESRRTLKIATTDGGKAIEIGGDEAVEAVRLIRELT